MDRRFATFISFIPDGDRKAYYESSQWTIKQNRGSVAKLRQENKMLRRNLADSKAGDERVINTAFRERDVERASMRGKSGKVSRNLKQLVKLPE